MLKKSGRPYPAETSELSETTETNAESDIYLIKEVKNGNGDAFKILAERYDYIISHHISKLYSSYSSPKFITLRTDKEDLFQECRIILYKAAKYYDFMREVKFSTYANICIKNYLISLCRKYGKTEKYSAYDFIPLDEVRENELAFFDSVDSVDSIGTLEILKTFYGVLTAFEKKVLMMYIENKSYKHMAQVLNKSVKSIDNAICRIKSKLKPYAEYFVSEY